MIASTLKKIRATPAGGEQWADIIFREGIQEKSLWEGDIQAETMGDKTFQKRE